MVFKFW